jgi:light-regulated signal transduction histidine kinase (bacteriophytochrome)
MNVEPGIQQGNEDSGRTAQGDGTRDRQRQQLLHFASKAAHEIAGPIDQISSLVALFIRRYRGKLDQEADTLLSHIEAARVRLGSAATGLRKCFQVTSAECKSEPVDMNTALEAATASLQPQIKESGAEFQIDKLPVVAGDRELIGLLFQALIDNALKFRRPEEPPRVVATTLPSANCVIVQLTDNGIGIDPKDQDAVFGAFVRLNGHAYPGAGLGLTLAQAIVELHGGRIWMESATPGTRVCFELPGARA